MTAATKKPQSFAWTPIWVPGGSLRDTFSRVIEGVEKNFNNVQTSIRQMIAQSANIEAAAAAATFATQQALDAKAPIASPQFTGFVGLPILTAIPADPDDGESQAFIYDNAGTLSLYIRAKTSASPDVQYVEMTMAAEP